MGHLRRQEISHAASLFFYLNQRNKSLSLNTLWLLPQYRTNKKGCRTFVRQPYAEIRNLLFQNPCVSNV